MSKTVITETYLKIGIDDKHIPNHQRELTDLIDELKERGHLTRYHYWEIAHETEEQCENCGRTIGEFYKEVYCQTCSKSLCDGCAWIDDDDCYHCHECEETPVAEQVTP